MIPVDELRPLSAARLLALWRDCREAADDPLERTLLCNARVLAACCYREGAPAFADEEEVWNGWHPRRSPPTRRL